MPLWSRAAAGGVGHPDEVLGVALLDLRDVAAGIRHVARGAGQRVRLEGVRHHPAVLEIDERAVDPLAVADEGLAEHPHRAVRLAEHRDRLLAGREESGAVLVVGPVQLQRGVADEADLEHVSPPGAAHARPSAERPGRGGRAGEAFLVEVVRAQMQHGLEAAERLVAPCSRRRTPCAAAPHLTTPCRRSPATAQARSMGRTSIGHRTRCDSSAVFRAVDSPCHGRPGNSPKVLVRDAASRRAGS